MGECVAERVAVGATQPEEVEEPALAASWRKTSRLTVSVGLLSKGLAKRATERQYIWCGVLVLWEIVSKENNYHLIYTHRPIAKHIKVPIAK